MSNLVSKEEKDFYIFYYQTKSLLKEIYKQHQAINNGKNIVTVSLSKP